MKAVIPHEFGGSLIGYHSSESRVGVTVAIVPGETVPATRQDWPRGLNQLGNTCYLNSLLQYFYTIKDLRDAVAHLLNSSSRKTVDEDKLTDDDLKRHRVGGRLVTRKEILRSKKFVSELAELFWHLEHADIASVTPTMELAKLALVTSKDEEDDIEQTATDSSNDTDATLVEDAPAPRAGTRTGTGSPVGSPGASSSSVLGKRVRDKEADVGSRVSIDSVTDKDNFVIISKSDDAGPSGLGLGVSAGAGTATDVEMKDAEAPAQSGAKPPLPPRKTSESVMMFAAADDRGEPVETPRSGAAISARGAESRAVEETRKVGTLRTGRPGLNVPRSGRGRQPKSHALRSR
ncbi:hypothetical protein EDB85DRAFT_2289386 [Lactarius pseudohatsudake]|nr:hypothetical protein EDB85DRAFT_2289386 [Lactarius pseudohatsudake]